MSSFFLHHQMEEGKEEDEGEGDGGQALTMREYGWCVILVVMMNMLRNIRFVTGCHCQGW